MPNTHAALPTAIHDESIRALAQELLETGVANLSDREKRIIARISRRHHIARDLNSTVAEATTIGARVADFVAFWGGSWYFVIGFFAFLLGWSALNSLVLAEAARFDPYPYIFLNLLLSMLAAVQAPIIMMSQNRQAARDRLQATLDYEINLKAEMEVAELHVKLDRLLADLADHREEMAGKGV